MSDVPLTPLYGFPFERPPSAPDGHEPGVTLHGSSAGGFPILAEKVEDKVEEVDAEIADLIDRVSALEFGWRPIDQGSHDGGAFDIPVPAGQFSRLRLTLRGHLDGLGSVRMRVNNDSTSELHRTGMIVINAASSPVVDAPISYNNATTWLLARWSSVTANTCVVDMISTNTNSLVAYQSVGGRHASTAVSHMVSLGWGRLNASRLVELLNIRPFSDASNQFASLIWELEGYRRP